MGVPPDMMCWVHAECTDILPERILKVKRFYGMGTGRPSLLLSGFLLCRLSYVDYSDEDIPEETLTTPLQSQP